MFCSCHLPNDKRVNNNYSTFTITTERILFFIGHNQELKPEVFSFEIIVMFSMRLLDFCFSDAFSWLIFFSKNVENFQFFSIHVIRIFLLLKPYSGVIQEFWSKVLHISLVLFYPSQTIEYTGFFDINFFLKLRVQYKLSDKNVYLFTANDNVYNVSACDASIVWVK